MADNLKVVLLAGMAIWGCAQTRPGYFRAPNGEWQPDISTCAKYEFPPRAKQYIDAALITVDIKVDADGTVTSVLPRTLDFEEKVPLEIQRMLTSDFEQAAIASLLYEKCPIHTINGKASPYKQTVSLFYEIRQNQWMSYQPHITDAKGKDRWVRKNLGK